jgi:hypothetical protein
MLSQRSLGAGAKKALPSDDEFNRVSFLSHFDGANNGVNNAFDDGSTSNHTITANGNVTQGSFGPFAREEGYWGVDFSGTAGDYINYASSADWSPATGDFTVEFWINPRAWDQAYMPVFVVDYSGSNSTSGLFIGMGSNSGTKKFVVNGYADADLLAYATLPALNTWTHILVSRSGTSLKLFYDGVAVATVTSSYNFGQSDLTIGSYGNYSRYLNATISNLHYVKGTATQTSNFTPPTGPSTAVTNTKLLACQSNRFVDNSASPHASTVAGNVAVSAFGPFLTEEVYDPAVNAASAYFAGSGDYLTAAASADFQLGTGDLTVEFWAYNTDAGASNNFLDNRANANGFALQRNASNKFNVYFEPSSTSVFTSGFVPKNAWIHFCWTRASGVNKFFIDGAQSGSNVSDASDFNSNSLTVGRSAGGGQEVTGYMCDVRIIKGTAVEPSAIPTAPLTAITNTKLLLNMADGQAIDSAAQNNMTLLGNTKLSTTQAKFGDTSMLFATSEADKLDLGDVFWTNSDWTHEFWIYLNTNSTATRIIFTQYTGQVVNGRCVIQYINETGKIMWFIGVSGGNITMDVTMSKGAWHHVALTRSGNDYKLFVDGTAGSTGSSSQDLESSVNTILGPSGFSTSGQGIDGFIDNLRFSKFVRYTNNFTAPSEPFADKGE